MKILLQAGHGGRTSGATGAPGEQKWTTEIVPKIASKLREMGFETKEVGADPSDSEIAGDWDLFLTVHYDADTYNDRGGFIDTPDPAIDFATKESNRIAEEIRKTYFPATGIPNHPERSNKKTKRYYMWSRLSAKTPCVIIEAGVGWRTEEDHKTLHFRQDDVVRGVTDGIKNALKPEAPTEPEQPDCSEAVKAVQKLREEDHEKFNTKLQAQQQQIDHLTKELEKAQQPIEVDKMLVGSMALSKKHIEQRGKQLIITEIYTVTEQK